MHAITMFLQLVTIILALLAGHSLAAQGLAQGRAVGGLDITIYKWRVVLKTYQVRPTKVFYQAALVAA